MNLRLISFNIIYYAILFLFYLKTQEDPSASLGVGYMALFFIITAALILLILLNKKVILIRNTWDWIGLFMATPVPLFLFISIFVF